MSHEGEITVLSSGETLGSQRASYEAGGGERKALSVSPLGMHGPGGEGARRGQVQLNLSLGSFDSDVDPITAVAENSLSSPKIYRGHGRSGSSPLSSPKSKAGGFLAGGGLFKSPAPPPRPSKDDAGTVNRGVNAKSSTDRNDRDEITEEATDPDSDSVNGVEAELDGPREQIKNDFKVSADNSNDDVKEEEDEEEDHNHDNLYGQDEDSTDNESQVSSSSRGNGEDEDDAEATNAVTTTIDTGPPRLASVERPEANSAKASMSTRRGLFCLEIYVHKTRWDNSKTTSGLASHGDGDVSPNPTVAFRFLDFPSQLIHANAANAAKRPAAPDYVFDRGKSCLLESSPSELHARCLATPLYIMLLDKGVDMQKLLGATVIDLADYVATASTPGVTAHPPESHYGAEGFIRTTYRLLNLVGTKVGSIDMSLRLRNLGLHMLAHWKNTHHDVRPPPKAREKSPQSLNHPLPRKAKLSLKERKRRPRRKKKEKANSITRLERCDPAKDMTDEIAQREAERDRALTAAVDAIAQKKNAKPGVDGEMVPHFGQSPLSPPPLYYYNDGAAKKRGGRDTLSPMVGPKRKAQRRSNTSMSPGSALGPTPNQDIGSTDLPDQPPRVTSQRRGTYFGTYSRKEANKRKGRDSSATQAEVASKSDENAFENLSREEQVRFFLRFWVL